MKITLLYLIETSLLQVLLRFISADNGKITIDGEDISSLQLERLRQSVSVIPQEPLLFSVSIQSIEWKYF